MSNLWLCVTCNATIDPHAAPLFAERWLCTRGGRLCSYCRDRLEVAKPGGSVSLGAGVRLAVTEVAR